ncbi:restriction endonuclease subunit S [Paracoccaceae bacterium Fryx2]|nr:restriction endonuclease subunit S [Paracoccaceae bacterium Fryx2]
MTHEDGGTGIATPKLRFPEFLNTEGWKETLLQKIARPVKERATTGDKDHVLSLSGEHGLILQSDYFGKKIAGDSTDRYLKIRKDDFVYNDRTTKASSFGTIKRLSNYPAGIVSPIYKCFRFQPSENPIFWEWYFESGSHEPALGGLVNEGARAGRFNISVTQFLSTSAWRPDEAEQQKIADCLASADALIEAHGRKMEALRAYKKGLMRWLFPQEGETQPRLRFPEFQDAEEWAASELGSKTVKVGSGITPNGGDRNYKSLGRPFVRSQNVGWGKLLLDDVVFLDEETHSSFPSTEIRLGDVLLNITGASIGRSAVADARIVGGNVNQHVCIIRTKKMELNLFYLNQYLISPEGQKQIDSFQAGGNRQGLNFAQIRMFSIPLPPEFDEQERIADCLTSLDDLIAAETGKLYTLKTHKKGLMQQLFPSVGEANA